MSSSGSISSDSSSSSSVISCVNPTPISIDDDRESLLVQANADSFLPIVLEIISLINYMLQFSLPCKIVDPEYPYPVEYDSSRQEGGQVMAIWLELNHRLRYIVEKCEDNDGVFLLSSVEFEFSDDWRDYRSFSGYDIIDTPVQFRRSVSDPVVPVVDPLYVVAVKNNSTVFTWSTHSFEEDDVLKNKVPNVDFVRTNYNYYYELLKQEEDKSKLSNQVLNWMKKPTYRLSTSKSASHLPALLPFAFVKQIEYYGNIPNWTDTQSSTNIDHKTWSMCFKYFNDRVNLYLWFIAYFNHYKENMATLGVTTLTGEMHDRMHAIVNKFESEYGPLDGVMKYRFSFSDYYTKWNAKMNKYINVIQFYTSLIRLPIGLKPNVYHKDTSPRDASIEYVKRKFVVPPQISSTKDAHIAANNAAYVHLMTSELTSIHEYDVKSNTFANEPIGFDKSSEKKDESTFIQVVQQKMEDVIYVKPQPKKRRNHKSDHE